MISKYGKGALRQPEDERDFSAEPILSAAAPVNWSVPFKLPDPGNEDQGSSQSCVAHAFSYYHVQIHAADYSRRDLYSRIVQPGGGAFLRDGAKAICTQGQATRDEVPDPTPEMENNMTGGAGTLAQEASHAELNYFSVGQSIDSIAQTIRDFKGAVFGVNGTNEGWADMANPRPPKPGEVLWGHALYAFGFHLHNGKKCIIAKSSYCKIVPEHHFQEEYFTSGNTYNGWTLIPKAQQKLPAKLTKWFGDAEVQVMLRLDSMERLNFIKANLPTWLPDYQLDENIIQLPVKRPF